mgnify:CR=1 FL=1|jgi:hypothetical protein|tara:strand:+ start:3783 stop:4421 length:639 start_codon:yes stop_codon:yes gene_type:complete
MQSPYYTDPIPVLNEGANDCPAFGILRISADSVFNDGKTQLKVSRPDTTYRGLYMIAGPQGIKAGKSGLAYFGLHRPIWALWDSGATTPAIGSVFGPMLDAFTLYSDSYGFTVVGKSETSPFRRVLVQQHRVTGIVVQIGSGGGGLAYQGSNTAKVLRFVSGSSQPDTTMTVTVYDGFLETGWKLVPDQVCDAELRGGRWVVTQSRGCATAV